LEEFVILIEQGKDQSCDSFAGRMVKDSLRSLKQGRDNDNEDDYTILVKPIDIK
jgi:hypothetical protein